MIALGYRSPCYQGLLSKNKAKSTCKAIKLKDQNSQLCQSKSHLNCNECTETKLKLPNGRLTTQVPPTCQWFPVDNNTITIGGSGGYCDSIPRPGTKFPQYGPKSELTGKYVKGQLLDQYPFGLNMYIIEDGSTVTKDFRFDRVHIFVEKSNDDSDVNDVNDDDDLGERLVMEIPQIG
jgi:hypothetical protein